ncbi:hypothetical protein OG799_19295 [Micromonospora sp. NBC_00898]|uniref:TenA family protein n=1 Tax=Micromonospora sp. NBC_00898 TaxID=2975981 RepID=UPI003868618F|nr:hypothetical protein OG799_19295 [Micromonospora sp. NBC_00898]
MPFRKELWAAGEASFDALLAHPVPTGICDGTLPRADLARLIRADIVHLGTFARAQALLAARAPELADLSHFAGIAIGSSYSATGKSVAVLRMLGGKAAEPGETVDPAYDDFITAVAHTGTYADVVVATLPRMWFHAEFSKELRRRGSPDRTYRKFIDTLLHDAYLPIVEATLERADAVGADAARDERERLTALFARAAEFELRLWDAGLPRTA